MKFIGFRINDDIHQALWEYCQSEGITVTECLTKLVEGLLSGEGLTSARPLGLESRTRALEEMLSRLKRGETLQEESTGGENLSDAGMEEEMTVTKEEIRELVGKVLDEREKELAGAISEAVKVRIEKGETETREQIAEVKRQVELIAGHANDRIKDTEEVYANLADTVHSLKEQAQSQKRHATAQEMLSCPDCGPFFLAAVRAANEELAKQAQSQAEAKSKVGSPKRYRVERPYGGGGFKWDDGLEMYCKETEDLNEVEEARGKGLTVVELEEE